MKMTSACVKVVWCVDTNMLSAFFGKTEGFAILNLSLLLHLQTNINFSAPPEDHMCFRAVRWDLPVESFMKQLLYSYLQTQTLQAQYYYFLIISADPKSPKHWEPTPSELPTRESRREALTFTRELRYMHFNYNWLKTQTPIDLFRKWNGACCTRLYSSALFY